MGERTPACWAWQTEPLPPAQCTCVGCTRYRANPCPTCSGTGQVTVWEPGPRAFYRHPVTLPCPDCTPGGVK